MVKVLSFAELKRLIDSKATFTLVDVRQPHELSYGSLPNARNVPLCDIPAATFERNKLIVVYCRTGSRSARAAEILEKRGFNVLNFAGSVQEWSKHDKSVRMY
jgi:rhodanese-related sulfurtransferase